VLRARDYRDWVTVNEQAVGALSTLADPTRRALYVFIRGARRPVSREEAAGAIGISRKLAAFHLEKLVGAGLLVAHPDRHRSARTIGRTPKVYLPSTLALEVAVPARDYRVLADILTEAIVSESHAEPARHAALRVAADRGADLGRQGRLAARPGRLGVERALTLAETVLRDCGYEPYRESAECLRLGNCPFHELAVRSPEPVCAINRALLDGVLSGLGATAVEAQLRPETGHCCVELRARR
jgi:predicted ArsR family transcriptional regulator